MIPYDSLDDALQDAKGRVERALLQWLPDPTTPPSRLHRAMHYALLGSGKRIRPFLVYATGQALGVTVESLDGPACAVESIHAYSLIHDDLPALDNDDLRRGKPTCHIAHGEAMAILAGDALQTLAYTILSSDHSMSVDSARRIQMIQTLSTASGYPGMVGGQSLDLESEGKSLTLEALERLHRSKTGALISASVRLAGLSANDCPTDLLERLDEYSQAIGLAFQIQDDILDVVADTATLGKPQGSDQRLEKSTYVALLGLDGARQRAQETHHQALSALAEFGPEADLLREISRYIIERGS